MEPKNGKTWILSEYFYPVTASTGYYVTEISRHLSCSGLDVGVICSQNKYRNSGDGSARRRDTYEGIEVFRALGTCRKNEGIIARSIAMALTTGRIFALMLKKIKKDDMVLVVTNPPLLLPCVFLLKILRSVKYTILVHDLYPENLVAMNLIKKDNFLFFLLHVGFFHIYKKASMIISIGRDMQTVIKRNIAGKAPKLLTISNWSDDDAIYPMPRTENKFLKSLDLQEKIVLQFAGNLGKAQDIDILLRLAKDVDDPLVHFFIIGEGEKAVLIKEHIRNEGRKNITFLDHIDKREQNELLNACDIGCVTLKKGMYGLGVPCKTYNILAAGKPIFFIGEKGSEVYELIAEHDIGWAFQLNEYEAIYETINSLRSHMDEIRTKGEKARKIAETTFSKKWILSEYVKAFSCEGNS